MKTLNDYVALPKRYFSINSGYKWGKGWSSLEESEDFHSTIDKLFADAGWIVTQPSSHNVCSTATKGYSSLYLHPMQFSGSCAEELLDEVSKIIEASVVARLYHIDTIDLMYMVDDEDDELNLYHLINDASIMDIIRECTTTKRSSLYKNLHDVKSFLRSRVNILTNIRDCVFSSDDSGYKYIDSWINKFIEEGWIVATSINGRPHVRWANKKEQKNLKPISI